MDLVKWEQEREKFIEKTKGNIMTKMGQVAYILEHHPETRKNDGLLIIEWIKAFRGIHTFAGLETLCLENEMSFESLRRARQKIQHLGFYLPDDETVIKRRRLADVWREVTGAVTYGG